MASIAILFVALLVVAAPAAHASTYTVSWNNGVDLNAWASSIEFKEGDSIVFYSAGTEMAKVPQSSYSSCSISNAYQIYESASVDAPIAVPVTLGENYIISGSSTLCNAGLHLSLDAAPAA